MTTDQYATWLAGLDAGALYDECFKQAKANVGRRSKTDDFLACCLECAQKRRCGNGPDDGPGIWRRALDEALESRRETERGNAEALARRKGQP